jgi:hypothetical protein
VINVRFGLLRMSLSPGRFWPFQFIEAGGCRWRPCCSAQQRCGRSAGPRW